MKKITLLITLLILVATSCRNTPIIGCKDDPFVVVEIVDMGNNMSKYYANRFTGGDAALYIFKPRVILPSKMYNIGDTIKPENFIGKYDTITFVR